MAIDIETFGQILKQHGVRDGAGVPCSFFKPLVNQMAADPELAYVSAASEGEAVAIAAGLTAAGRPAFALMQNSGLGNAVNPITSMVQIYGIPLVLLVSHRGEPGRPDEPQHELMGRITEQLSRLCELETFILGQGDFAEQLASVRSRALPAAWVCRKGQLSGGPEAPRRTIELSTGAVSVARPGRFVPQMRREQALRALLPLLNGPVGGDDQRPAVISTTGKLSRELYELDDRDHRRDNRLYMVGSMGCAAGFGLGVARGSTRKVLVLDGDGALLMKLGTLATIGATAPTNLHHIVFDNGAHESTGGQATNSPAVDFASVALACGYRAADTVASEAELLAAVDRQLSTQGPTLLRVAIEVGSRADLGRPTLTPRDGWRRFCDFLAGAGASDRAEGSR